MQRRYALKTAGLTKRFGDFTAVDKVDFEIGEHEAVGIIGPNGAGKTTFLNLLTGRYLADEGSVWYKDRDITRLRPEKRVHLGILRTFQLVHVFDNLNVYDNVALSLFRKIENKPFPLKIFISRLQRKDLAQPVQEILEEFYLSSQKHELVGNLSLGNKKKLELAMVYTADPDVLLLDEPFAGLGDKEIDEVLVVLRKSVHKKTVIIIEHKISKLTTVVDKLAVMHEGRIIASGPCEETLNHPEVRKSYWRM